MPATSSLLRFATAGSVDDGKSTLIGRLLYDSKSLMADQVEVAEKDLANLTETDAIPQAAAIAGLLVAAGGRDIHCVHEPSVMVDQIYHAIPGPAVVEGAPGFIGNVVLVVMVTQAEVVVLLQVALDDRVEDFALPAVPVGSHVAIDHHWDACTAKAVAVARNAGVLLVDQGL